MIALSNLCDEMSEINIRVLYVNTELNIFVHNTFVESQAAVEVDNNLDLTVGHKDLDDAEIEDMVVPVLNYFFCSRKHNSLL